MQKRHPSQQMQSLFHHSLIKMIVLHQLGNRVFYGRCSSPMKFSQTHSLIIIQIYPHHLILLPPLLHHLLLTMNHHLPKYPLLKKTSLPHLLLMHQIKKEDEKASENEGEGDNESN